MVWTLDRTTVFAFYMYIQSNIGTTIDSVINDSLIQGLKMGISNYSQVTSGIRYILRLILIQKV